MAEDRIDQLYSYLKQGGIVSKDRESFRKKMLAPGQEGYKNRYTIWKIMHDNGFTGHDSYEDFAKNGLGLHAVPSPTSQGGGRVGGAAAVQRHTQPTKPKRQGGGMSAAERARFINNTQGMVNSSAAAIQRTKNQMDYAKGNAGLKVKPVHLGQNSKVVKRNTDGTVAEQRPVLDMAPQEQPGQTYVTESGNEYGNRAEADTEQNAVDQYNYDNSLDGQLNNAYAERDRLDEALKRRRAELEDKPWWRRALEDMGKATHSDLDPMATANDPEHQGYENDEEYMQLMSAARKNHQTIQTLEDKKNGKMNDFWHSFGTTAMNGYTFADGMPELRDATALEYAKKHIKAINEKRQKGLPLTREEQAAEAVLKANDTDNAVQSMYGDYGAWGRAGGMTANSVDFMKDFLLMPGGAGMAKGIAGKVAGIGGKMLAKEAGESALKAIPKTIARATLKATGVLIGAHTAGSVISNTTGIGRTAALMAQKASGNVTRDEKGGYKIENEQSLMHALASAEREQARENGSEMFGEFIPGGKLLGGLAKKGLEKIGLSKVSNFLTQIGNKEWYKQYSQFLKTGGYNGIPGEALEEYEGELFDALTGHASDAWKDFTDAKQNTDIWLGCATMGALMGAIPMGIHMGGYYKFRHDMNKADKVAAYRMTKDKWAPLKEELDNTDNGHMADVVTKRILMNNELSAQEKKAAMDYVRGLTNFRGFNIAQASNAGDEESQANQARNDAYRTGYNAVDGTAAQQQPTESIATGAQDGQQQTGQQGASPMEHDIKMAYEQARDGVAGMYGEDFVQQLDDDPDAVLATLEDENRGKQKAQAYVDAKAMYDGMMQRAKDDLDDKVQTVENEVDSHVNPVDQGGDGMIHPATMKVKNDDGTEHQVYIVSGHVEMMADGTMVDKTKSSPSIVIRDPQTGETKMVSPDDILSVDEPIDPEQEKQTAVEAARQEFAGQRADQIDGLAPKQNPQMNDEVWVKDENDEPVHGVVTQVDPVTGEYMVRTDKAVNGKVAQPFQAGQLYEMATTTGAAAEQRPTEPSFNEQQTETETTDNEQQAETEQPIETETTEPGQPAETEADADLALKGTAQNHTEGEAQAETREDGQPQRAIDRIPSEQVTDKKGNTKTVHHWEQAEPGDTWDALNEQYQDDKRTQHKVGIRVKKIDDQIKSLDKQIKKLDDSDDFDADFNDADGYKALLEQKKELEAQKKYWQQVQSVPQQRKLDEDRRTAEEKAAAEAARKQAEAEAIERARQEREQVKGVPDVVNDKPGDARQRGFRNVNGSVVERQQGTGGVTGRESNVKFSSKDTAKGHVKMIDADELQPSHVSGQRNPRFFIDEAQPKDRTDAVSSMAAEKIASSLNPEEITGDGSAYQFSAPTVNSRGEVIQGNNRSDALKLMWSSPAYEKAQTAYKQYIADHAEEFGFTPEDVEKIQQMEHPVMVNELDVPDDEAIRLGQMRASDNESGGIERIDPVTTSQKLGGKVSSFANVLLSSPDEDASLSDVLMQNGAKAVKWLRTQGAISDTAAQSAFDKKGNLTPEARMDLQNILKQSLFQGGVSDLPTMFGKMPAKAQKAILSTFMRDFDSAESERILPEMQKAIEAWYDCAMSNEAFAKAPNYKAAKVAMRDWESQTNLLDDNMPSDKFSNFAMELACRLQGCSMREAQQSLNDFFDLVQGKSQGDLFGGTTMGEQADRQESIRRIFNIEYKPISNSNGKTRSNAVADNSSQSGEGRQGSPTDGKGRERAESGSGSANGAGGTESHDEEGIDKGAVRTADGGYSKLPTNYAYRITDAQELQDVLDNGMFRKMPDDKIVPGSVKVITSKSGRRFSLGKQHGNSHGGKAFAAGMPWGDNGNGGTTSGGFTGESYYIAIPGNNVDGWRVGHHGHYSEPQPFNEIEAGKGLWLPFDEDGDVDLSTKGMRVFRKVGDTYYEVEHPEELFKDKGAAAQQQPTEPSGDSSHSIGATSSSEKKEAERQGVNTEPSDKQKEAGNYKKGHIKVDGYDITIENPKGSTRSGKDVSGKAWSVPMHYDYGYIRGTEGVDGDHIDVYLSDEPTKGNVYVVDQIDQKTGKFDEHKVMYGFPSKEAAVEAYKGQYTDGWKVGTVTEVSREDFKKWVESSKRKTKPFSEYKSVKEAAAVQRPTEPGTKEQWTIGEPKRVSADEAALRDSLNELMREAGIEVIDDEKEGQRVLDMANGHARMMSFREPYDYEKYPLGHVEPGISNKEVGVVAASANHGFANYKEAKAWAKENVAKTYHTEETGGKGEVRISNGAVDKFLSQSAVDKSDSKDAHLAVLKVLPDVLKESIDVETHPDFLKGKDGKRSPDNGMNRDVLVHRCYGAVSIDGKLYRVKITLKEDVRNKDLPSNTHSYEATKIELLAGTLVKPEGDNPNTNNSIPAANLLKNVGLSYNPSEKVLAASEKRAKSIREQRVYHGSGADFDHFDHSHMGEGEGAQAHGWGTYVTMSESVGKKYATKSDQATGLKRSELESNIRRAEEQLPFLKGEAKVSKEKELQDLKTELNHLDGSKFVYTVDIPDDTGDNYLEEKQTLQALNRPDMADRIDKVMDDYLGAKDFWHSWQTPGWAMREEFVRLATGQHPGMSRGEAERKFSELLSKADVVGLHYDGRKDGDCYVIFNDKDLKITEKVKFFRTANGEAYGFTVGGKIYIDPRIATSETPIHEYAHLWAEALRKVNPKEWQNVVELMKGCKAAWEQVKKEYPELKTDDEIADEVLAHYSGKRGAERLRTEAAKAVDDTKGVLEKAEVVSAFSRLKDAIKKAWKHIAEDVLHIHFTTADEVADKVMYDLLNKVKPGEAVENGAHGSDGLDGSEAERVEIERKAKEDGSWMKAPNGQESNLSEDQWVTVRTKHFKDWFGDWEEDPEESSQAVDENGEPKVFYHNTDNDFTVFDANRNGTHTDAGWLGDGFYFYGDENEGDGYGHKKMEVFLNVRNMYYATSTENEELADANDREKSIAFRNEIEDEGYDGVYYNGDLRQEAVVFYPEQIKSATDNVGTYDAANPDIRYEKRTDRGYRKHRSDSTEDVDAVNKRFNEEPQEQIDGQQEPGHVYQLGKPSPVLLSTGIPDLPIQLSATRLKDKATSFGHDYALEDVKGLVKALQHPLAVFAYGNKEKAQNVVVELEKDGKNFIVGLSLRPVVNGRVLEINSIRNVFPKNNSEWLNWISQGKALYIDKKKVQDLIDIQRTILADVDYLDLNSVAKIINGFENPVIKDENVSGKGEDGSIKDAPTTAAEAEEADVLYREVDDEEAARLDREPTVKVYRAMQEHDGKLYPPMSGRVKTQVKSKNGTTRTKWVWRSPIEIGKWEQSEEHPELANEDGTFTLDKGNGSKINAAYNPYIHTSRTPINDQFSSAWNRPELVTVEVEIPASELTSGYHAEKAKDATGEVEWKSGPVGREMAAQGKPRMVILSRWDKPVRIVPVEEVADEYAVRLAGTGIKVPFNTVPPALREALVARGVEISEPEEGNAGKASRPSYEEWLKGNTRHREGSGAYSDEELSLMNDPVAKWLGKSNRTKAQQKAFANRERRSMESAVRELADRLHLDNVNIVMDASTLEGRKARAKGFYDRNTGQITIVIPNHRDVDDVMQTLLHEGVAHYGLRQLFGEHFDTFLRNVYEAADNEVRRKIIDLALHKYGGNFETATEEYLASLAERTNFENMPYTFWTKIKRMFLAMLHDIGFENFADTHAFTLSDNELRYILWRSYENLKEPGRFRSILGEAEDVAKQAELKVGNYGEAAAQQRPTGPSTTERHAIEQQPREREREAAEGEVGDVRSLIRRLVSLSKKTKEKMIRLVIGKVNRRQIRDLRSEGLDVDDSWRHSIENSRIIHAQRRYGITDADFERIPEILDSYDNVHVSDNKNNSGNKVVIYEKKYSNGTTYYLEEVRNGRHSLAFQTMYKKESGDSDGLLAKPTPKRSETTSDNSTTSTAKLGNSSESVVNKGENVTEPAAWGKQDLLSKAEQISRGIEPDLLFRDTIEDDDDTARETYNRMADRARETFREAWQDSMINVRRLQEAVLKQRGEKMEDWEDSYNEENRSHGHAQDLDEYFDRTLYKPLLKAVNAVAKAAKVSIGDVTEYMMAKHGLERNEVFARRDAQAAYDKAMEKAKGTYDALMNAANAESDPKKKDALEKQAQKVTFPDFDDLYQHFRLRDYAGLTDLTGQSDVQDAEVEAKRIVADMEARAGAAAMQRPTQPGGLIGELWKATNEATGWTLEKAYESGIISKGNYEQVSRMFNYYIPLRGWKEDTAEDLYDYVGGGNKGNAFSPTLHKAKGRRSEADNPIAYISSMAVSAIEQGRKNLVKQSFMRFVENHPTNLVTVSEMWYRNYGTDTAPDWREDVPNIPEDATADEIADIVKQHEDDMKQLEAQGLATKERGRLHLGVPVKQGQALEHHVEVMVNGKKYVLYINGNPRAAQALNGTRARRASEHGVTRTLLGIADNFSNMKGFFGKRIAKMLRGLATMQRAMGAFFTSKNPAFMLGNAFRDVDMALASTIIDEPIKYAHLFRTNMLRLGGPIGMIRLMHWYNKKGAGMEFADMKNMKTMQRYFYEFVKGGGRTGFTSLRDIEDYKEELAAKFADMKRSKVSPVLLFKDLAECFEYCNRAVEDMTRFATFVAAREYGKSVRESVSDAKNITLNFNRKGSGEMGNVQTRDLIIFVNPAIQALDRIGSMARRHPVKFSAYTAIRVLAGMGTPFMTMLLWNVFGGGDDGDDKWNAVEEYWKLPTWTRRSNLVFWIPTTKKFAMIPLAQEMRVANGFGEALTSELTGHSNENTMLTLASGLAGLLPIDFEGNGGNPLITLAPTAIQPLLQVDFNTDFTGRPIYKDNDFNKYDPSFQKAYIGTPKELISLSAKINELTGGNEHKQGWWERTKVGGELNNPAVVNHLLKGYFGGMYSMLAQTGGLLWNAYLGETPDVQEVPIANRIVTAVRETQQNGKAKLPDWYYDLSEESKRHQNEFSGYKKDYLKGDEEGKKKLDEIIKSKDFVHWQQVNAYIGAVQQIRTAMSYEQDDAEKQKLQKNLDEVLGELEKLR